MNFDKLLNKIYENLNIEFPNKFNISAVGSCMYAAEYMSKKLLEKGISDFQIIEGYVKIKNVEGKFQHTWIETKDEKIDPTIKQFFPKNVDDDYIEGKVKYFIKKKYTPKEYFELCKKYPEDPSKYFL